MGVYQKSCLKSQQFRSTRLGPRGPRVSTPRRSPLALRSLSAHARSSARKAMRYGAARPGFAAEAIPGWCEDNLPAASERLVVGVGDLAR